MWNLRVTPRHFYKLLRTPRFIYASASESLPGGGFPKTYHQPPGKVRAFPDPFHRPIKLLIKARQGLEPGHPGASRHWWSWVSQWERLPVPALEIPEAAGHTQGAAPLSPCSGSGAAEKQAGLQLPTDRDLGEKHLGTTLRNAGASQGPRRISKRQTRRRRSPGRVAPHHLLPSLRRGSKPLSCEAPVV